MSEHKAQRKVGIPVKPRGQQTGGPGNPSHARESMNDTPAMNGMRAEESEFFDDDSAQMIGAGGVAPQAATPSTPAAVPSGTSLGQSNAEKTFKDNQK